MYTKYCSYFIRLGNSQGNEVILQVLRYCGSFHLFFLYFFIGKVFSGNNRNHPLYKIAKSLSRRQYVRGSFVHYVRKYFADNGHLGMLL